MDDNNKKNVCIIIDCRSFEDRASIKVEDPNCHLSIDGFHSVSAGVHFEISRIGSLDARNICTEDKKPSKVPRKLFSGWTPPRKG